MKPILLLLKRFFFCSKLMANHMRACCWLLFLLIFSLQSQTASASHGFGGELTYHWLYGTTYQFTGVLYRDCSGIPADASLSLNIFSASCGVNVNVTLSQVAGTGQEITYPCPTSPTTCNGGSHVGIQKYVYTVTYDLGHYCTDWVFSWNTCCRATSITTLSGATGDAIYIEATLNNVAAPTNSSPTFSNSPITFLCLGQTFTYNPGGTDINGDSLAYSLIDPKQSATTNVTFNFPYTAQQPISSSPPITINPLNGNMTMTPTMIEIGVCAMLIKEYENGVLIGSVERDMPIIVSQCNNHLPVVCGINGSNNYTDTISCPGGGTQVCFTVCSNDSDALDTVTMTVDTSGISGASFTITGSPHPTGNFCWTATVANVRSQPYTFTVTARDNACPYDGVQTTTFSIYVLSSLNASVAGTNVLCNGNTNGTATVNASSSHLPITYQWSTGQTTSSINGLTAGNYSVTATDANGCTGAFTQVITQPTVIAAILNPTNVPCNGGNGGSILLYTGGGTPPYSYLWSNGQTNYTASNLTVGSYTVTITDAHGCTNTFSQTLTQPPPFQASTTQFSACGSNSGVATVSATGGVGPYTYKWSGGGTDSTTSGLSAGSYNVTVTDHNHCALVQTVVIPSSPAINVNVSVTPNTACGSNCTGSASISVSGGTAPFSYTWNTGQSSSSSLGLCAGNYVITVTDANSCTAVPTVTITQPFSISFDTAHTDILCHGDLNGTASVTAISGTAPFSYAWSTGDTTTSISGLSGGTYSLTVTDANGCKSLGNVTITQPSAIILVTSAIPSCSGPNNGQATVSASGGTPTYNYAWSNGANTSSITNISGGTYTVTITDSRDCTSATSVVVGAAPVVVVNSPAPICRGDSVTLIATGALTYTWSPSATLSSSTGDTVVSHLTSNGTYTVTGTGTGGCTNTATVTVTVNPLPTIVVSPGIANICGGTSINLTANGATSYVWSPAATLSSSTGAVVTSTPPANGITYTVIGTDANGCTNSATKHVTTKLTPDFSFNPFQLCHGDCIHISLAYFNSGNILYTWSPPNGLSSTVGLPTACPLATTTYTVIGNLASCRDTQTVTVTVNPYPNANITGVFTICNGNNATLTAIGNGNNYSWSTGQLTSSISVAVAGTYTVSITNNYGCTSTASQVVTIDSLPLNFPTQYYICETTPVTLTASGGNSYSWSPSTGLSCDTCPNPVCYVLSPTTYTVTVTAGACSASAVVHVDPAPNTGQPTITITGGDTLTTDYHGPYQWYYNGVAISGATDSFYIAIPCGHYSIQAADSFGCEKVSADINTCVGISEVDVFKGIWIYPNPAGEMFTIYGQQFMPGTKVVLYNAIGQIVYRRDTEIKYRLTQITVDISGLNRGVYFVELMTGEKVYRSKIIKE